MHYEFTEDAIEWKGKKAFRIRATKDIPEHGVEKRHLGGFVTKDSTLSETSWVGGDASIWHSVLEGEVLVDDNAVVQESTLRRRCRVLGSSQISHSDVSGVRTNDDSRIEKSVLVLAESLFTGYVVTQKAVLEGCKMTYTAKSSDRIQFSGETKLVECIVKGKAIEMKGKTFLKYSEIDGESIFLENVEYAHGLEISGMDIILNNVQKMVYVKMKEVKTVKLMGRLGIHFTDIKGFRLEIRGDSISIRNSHISGKYITIEKAVALNEVQVEGVGIELTDFVSIEGKKEDRVRIRDNVQMKDLVSIATAENKRSMSFEKQTLTGDVQLTGV